MSLIQGMEDVITHIKNQELRIQKLEEENKKLKEQNEKLKRSDKKMYQLLTQEADSHGKTLNNMFEAFNLYEQNHKQAELHANRFDDAESLEGHYRTLIGEWYIICFKAQNKNKNKELEEENKKLKELVGSIKKETDKAK
jgi:cell shape-determining protein MreC